MTRQSVFCVVLSVRVWSMCCGTVLLANIVGLHFDRSSLVLGCELWEENSIICSGGIHIPDQFVGS